jgi:hypothetical protein
MVSKTRTFTKGAAWVGLLGLVLSGPAAAASQYTSGYATSRLAQLAEVLSERGWHTRPGEDGSLLFATAASGFATPQTLSTTSATDPGTTPTASGPTDAGASARDHRYGARTASLATPLADGWLTNLRSQLEARGWVVTQDQDRGLSFHRGSPPAPIIGFGEHRPNAAVAVTAPKAPDWLSVLGQRLSQRGWGVARDTDGSLRLYPRTGLPTTAPGQSSPTATAAVDPRIQIQRLMADRGWGMHWDSAGDLFLRPLARHALKG